MGANPHMQVNRPDGALLAGVCAGIARALRWNVWVLRALFLGFLALKTVAALVTYAVLALAMHLLGNEKITREKGIRRTGVPGVVTTRRTNCRPGTPVQGSGRFRPLKIYPLRTQKTLNIAGSEISFAKTTLPSWPE